MIRGFHPVRHLTGGQIRTNAYPMAASTTIFKGDLVVMNASGFVSAAAAGANTAILGVAAEYAVNSGAAGARWIHVYDDQDIVYACRATAAVSESSRFKNAPNAVGSGGNPNTGLSSHVLNAAGIATTATLALKILGITDVPGNAWGTSNVELEVVLNSTSMRPAVVGT